jgi:hypothetical protein
MMLIAHQGSIRNGSALFLTAAVAEAVCRPLLLPLEMAQIAPIIINMIG